MQPDFLLLGGLCHGTVVVNLDALDKIWVPACIMHESSMEREGRWQVSTRQLLLLLLLLRLLLPPPPPPPPPLLLLWLPAEIDSNRTAQTAQ